MAISACTQQDYIRILDELAEFWDGRDVRSLHYPFLIHEFGNSAFVIRVGSKVAAYLFGFISQTEAVGYVHLVAVRASARRRHLAARLLDHFVQFARRAGFRYVKAITTPSNAASIAFHKSLGMQLLGEPNPDDIPVLADYRPLGISTLRDRVCMTAAMLVLEPICGTRRRACRLLEVDLDDRFTPRRSNDLERLCYRIATEPTRWRRAPAKRPPAAPSPPCSSAGGAPPR